MRIASAVLLFCLLSETALAESPFSATSNAEAGWSSNISETPTGPSDFYLRHNHDLSLRGSLGSLDWKAGLKIDQTKYLHHSGEDDLEVTGGLEVGLPLASDMRLRLGYAVTREWTGTIADFGGTMVDISGEGITHEFIAELLMAGEGRAFVVGVDGVLSRPGDSVLAGLGLPPLRLAPEENAVTVRVDGEWVVGENLFALGRGHAFSTQVPELDKIAYGREPSQGLRLGVGLRHASEAFTVSGYVGADTVWPTNASHLIKVVPYVDVEAELALREGIGLGFRGLWGVGRDEPIDGVASQNLDLELALRLALHERVTLSAKAGLNREEGLYFPAGARWQKTLGADLTAALTDKISVRIGAQQKWVEQPGGDDYAVTRLNMGVSGAI